MNKVGIKQFYNTKYDAKNPEFWKSIELPDGVDKDRTGSGPELGGAPVLPNREIIYIYIYIIVIYT